MLFCWLVRKRVPPHGTKGRKRRNNKINKYIFFRWQIMFWIAQAVQMC